MCFLFVSWTLIVDISSLAVLLFGESGMRNRFGFVFNGRVFLCEPFQYSTRGILLLEEQAFTAKTGKKIIEKHLALLDQG